MASGALITPDYPSAVVGGELRLPRPPGVIRQFWARHPWLTDWLITALYFLPTFLSTWATAYGPDSPGVPFVLIQLAGVCVTATAILFRRHRPWLTMAAAWAICLLVNPLGNTDVLPIALSLYALAVYRSTRAAWIAFGVSIAVATTSSYLSVWISGDRISPFGTDAPAASSQFGVLMLIATLIGITVGNRRRYLLALIERARDLARERDQQAQLATALERSRIAREMHDIVSHTLTVMVTLADGSAATVGREPDRASETMRLVAETGRTALGDMRRMLGVLAESGNETELIPQPGWSEIPELIERFKAAGLPVSLTTAGRTVSDPSAQLTIYRIVQEGLTNVLKHAPGSQSVEVEISTAADNIEVSIRDDGVRTAADNDTPSGRGLIGMRERLGLYDGTLRAGPRVTRGWELLAQFEVPA